MVWVQTIQMYSYYRFYDLTEEFNTITVYIL